jgi:hypothetical protein
MSTPQDEAAAAAEGLGAAEIAGERQAQQPTEEEMRAAYEAELSRITTEDMILQAAASLLNIGGMRLGLVPDAKVERDLEQVRDAIDAVRGLLPVIERRGGVGAPNLRPLRDALSQLQMAYTREVQASSESAPAESAPAESAPAAGSPKPKEDSSGPGPAQSSGRLWVPGS